MSLGLLNSAELLLTGTGPPLEVRPPPRSDICAFSSSKSGENGLGVLMASSSAYNIAEWVRPDMRRAGCGLKSGGYRTSDNVPRCFDLLRLGSIETLLSMGDATLREGESADIERKRELRLM